MFKMHPLIQWKIIIQIVSRGICTTLMSCTEMFFFSLIHETMLDKYVKCEYINLIIVVYFFDVF